MGNGRIASSRIDKSPPTVPAVKPTKIQPAERVRELRLKQTVQNIAGKLKWHEEDSELKEDTLAELESLPVWIDTSLDNESPHITAEMLMAQFTKRHADDDENSDTEQRAFSHSHNKKFRTAPHNDADHILIDDIAPIVYALSRGTDRAETLKTVDKLTKLCNFGGEVRLA
eukprot:gene45657-56889_t